MEVNGNGIFGATSKFCAGARNSWVAKVIDTVLRSIKYQDRELAGRI
jgi:hypothetical protein